MPSDRPLKNFYVGSMAVSMESVCSKEKEES